MKRALLFCLLSSTACGGSNWSEVSTSAPNKNTSFTLWTFAEDDVWLGGTSVYHFDGKSWEERPVPGGGAVVDFYGLGPDDLWAVGSRNVYRWNGQSWREVPATAGVTFAALWRIWGASADAIWIANTDNSRVYRWDGSTWSRKTLQFVAVDAIWGSSEKDIWLTGTFNTYRYNGAIWSKYDTDPSPSGAHDIWGFGPNDVWAVGGREELVHFDGSTWKAIRQDDLEGFNGIWGSASNNIYAVGRRGAVGHYDGSSWSTELALSGVRNFTMIHGSSPTNVWATAVDLKSFTGHVYRLK